MVCRPDDRVLVHSRWSLSVVTKCLGKVSFPLCLSLSLFFVNWSFKRGKNLHSLHITHLDICNIYAIYIIYSYKPLFIAYNTLRKLHMAFGLPTWAHSHTPPTCTQEVSYLPGSISLHFGIWGLLGTVISKVSHCSCILGSELYGYNFVWHFCYFLTSYCPHFGSFEDPETQKGNNNGSQL